LKKNNLKKITFTCGLARQNIFLVKIVVWIVVWSKTRYNILVKIMVGIVVVYKMTKKKNTNFSLIFKIAKLTNSTNNNMYLKKWRMKKIEGNQI
jgi:hypothetical protein